MNRTIIAARKKRLGALLREARREAGLSQSALAQRIGASAGFVGKVERGDRRLDVVLFIRIAQILEVDPARIVASVRNDCQAGGMASSPSRAR
jgi:transcriptional regulator with XRE-family HTH domain